MATTTTNYGFDIPQSTDLVKDGATAIATLGQDIDTAMNTALGTKKAGMVLLNTTSFSGVATQSFSNFTTASFSQYKVVFAVKGSTNAVLNFKFRENLTDKSTGYYGSGWYFRPNSTSGISGARLNASDAVLTAYFSTIIATGEFLFSKPQATQGNICGISEDTNSGGGNFFSYENSTMTDVTGFTLIPSSGTLTGKVSIYGCNE